MIKNIYSLISLIALALSVSPAQAEEVFVGGAVNGVDTPFSLDVDERGANIQIGMRGNPEKALKAIGSPSLYAFVSLNTEDGTDFIAGGLSWHINLAKKLYVRPGIGIALQGRTAERFRLSDGERLDLGSAVLFEPELILGFELSKNIAAEATWVHISHARLFGGQNPGIDMMGARLVFKF